MIGNYKVVVTDDVQKDLDNFVYYLLVEKLNEQAAIRSKQVIIEELNDA